MSVRRWYLSKYLWMSLFFAGALAGFGAWRFFTVKADKTTYLFGTIDRGDIVMQVAANGTLAAVTTVQVGTQVSGIIQDLYADYNSEVKKGQLLAKLNPDLFQAQYLLPYFGDLPLFTGSRRDIFAYRPGSRFRQYVPVHFSIGV